MVVSIISIPGVLSPEMADRFRLAMEQALKKSLDRQATDVVAVKKQVDEGFNREARPEAKKEQEREADGKSEANVEGYKMEEVDSQDKTTELPSSGAQWYALLFATALLGLVAIGMGIRGRRAKMK